MADSKVHKCKHGEVDCGRYYDCGKCLYEKRKRIWNSMTQEQRNYDNFVDPMGQYTSGLSISTAPRYEDETPQGCSCHICAPCSYCTNLTD